MVSSLIYKQPFVENLGVRFTYPDTADLNKLKLVCRKVQELYFLLKKCFQQMLYFSALIRNNLEDFQIDLFCNSCRSLLNITEKNKRL